MGKDAAGFNYDTIPVGYYDSVFKRQQGIQSRWHHDKFARIRAELEPGTLLDIGCGPGTFIGSLSSEAHAIGVDISEQQILYAREHNGGTGRTFTVCGEPPFDFADDTFDTVTLIELIEHLEHDHCVTLLKEARRVLKPGGDMFVSTPDYSGLWPYLETLVNRLGDVSYEDQHITRFNKSMMRNLLETAGLEVSWIENYQFLSPFAAAFGWKAADLAHAMEPGWLVRRFGFLLLAKASKA